MSSAPLSSTAEMRQTRSSQRAATPVSGVSGTRDEWVQSVPLPAVKGTIGGIESPWRGRGHAASPSLTNVGDYSPTPSRTAVPSVRPSPAPSTPPRATLALDPTAGQLADQTPTLVANPDAPLFRSDPAVQTCLEGLPFDTRDLIRSLFLS